MKLTLNEIGDLVVCPACRHALSLSEGRESVCTQCGQVYAWEAGTWSLIPSTARKASSKWSAWDVLQENGVASYTEAPEGNLFVSNRPESLDFSRFCRFSGIVLDVGCGPQPWPSYFRSASEGTRFVGVDPLANGELARYTTFRALAEYQPFRDHAFDHVIFVTSLDHFVDPRRALEEGMRVCRGQGELDVFLGEKSPLTPRPAVSPEWYNRLQKPEGANDVFHMKRLTYSDLSRLSTDLGLRIAGEETHPVDRYRTNRFLRLKRPGR